MRKLGERRSFALPCDRASPISVLTERVRRALAPDYDVESEIASGGMGVVYRARDVALDRVVAIKIIRPDLATASAAERFLREARALASFNHPNIVPIYRAGEAQGLAYYVMEYCAGENLAERLARGPLSTAHAMRLAGDLLGALEAVHERGIVHRDIKPTNIFFLADGRAILADFGIARSFTGATPLTAPDGVIGTPGYMPPEQLAGAEATARADLCAAAMVIYEAFTGRQWEFDPHTESADWRGVPPAAAAALRRALKWSAGARWASAGEFRRALVHRRLGRREIAAALGAVVLVAAWLAWRPAAIAHRVAIHPFAARDASGLGDSLARRLVGILRVAPDVSFDLAAGAGTGPAGFEVNGTVTREGAGVRVVLQPAGFAGGPEPLSAVGAPDAVLDTLASRLLLAVWMAYGRAAADLPFRALPRSVEGLNQWAIAETQFARARWEAARSGYASAIRTDSTCLLCVVRISVIARWLRVAPDTAITHRPLREIAAFPASYQLMIRAGQARAHRWEVLDTLNQEWPGFVLGQFAYADELFHRGALVGRPRADAFKAFRHITEIDPDFVPAWEHLAWVAAAEGDSVTAWRALAEFEARRDTGDVTSGVLLMVHTTGAAWRFRGGDAAMAEMGGALARPEVASFPDLDQGPAYLATFDAPRGAIGLGEAFAQARGRPDLLSPGLAGQVGGLVALGLADSALRVASLLRGTSMSAEPALAASVFDAALTLFDSSVNQIAAWPRLRAALTPLTREGAASVMQRHRAAWLLVLLARRAGAGADAHLWRILLDDESGDRPFRTFLDADSAARSGNPRHALQLSERLLALDSAQRSGEPLFRAALHLSRAQWNAATGNLFPAVAELRWYANADIVDRVTTVVQAVQVDWALGTLARWRAARLLETASARGPEICAAYGAVATLWKGGDALYRARADTAMQRRGALGCAP